MTKNFELQRISRSKSLSSEVTEQLHELITSEKIKVGEKLPGEHKLCDLFGVSRTVIREAISQLKSIGLVETKRGIGAIVIEPNNNVSKLAYVIDPTDIKSILHILELRMSVETMAAELAAHRHTEEDLKKIKSSLEAFEKAAESNESTHHQDFDFHYAIATASQNPYYQQLYRQFNQDAIPRTKALGKNKDSHKTSEYTKKIHGEHLAIYAAIEARDANAARAAMHEHLKRAYDLYTNAS